MSHDTQSASYTTLQSLMWPEPGISTERDLYVRINGASAISVSKREVQFVPSGIADFGTWFNLFNTEKWKRECGLTDLSLALTGEGTFELSIMLAARERSWENVLTEIITLDPSVDGGLLRINLQHILSEPHIDGVAFFSLKAMCPGKLTDARWESRDTPKRAPKLNLAVTTFKREEAVIRTIKRFATFMETSPVAANMHLTVTDNGRTVADHLDGSDLPDCVSLVPNENLGGAGGFTRGLLETRDRGDTHCLFMDDDAAIHMENLERTWLFLAYATDPRTAVAGAMMTETHRWAIWENGAQFNGRCLPLHMGTDLRKTFEMVDMELEASLPVKWNFYAGWWFFAFPVDTVDHYAFPFFVRGDDVSFSLANDFNTVTLNGVVSIQESFTEKESPLTWYLDLRSHMVHHLTLPKMEIGKWRVLKTAAWFLLRNLPRMHYETIEAINLALEDVTRGPEFFDTNADLAKRRADIKALTVNEAWKPLASGMPLPPHRETYTPFWHRTMMKFTLNGLLVPGFTKLGSKILLHASQRGHMGVFWGASEITNLNTDRDKFYTVKHSKIKGWKGIARFIKASIAFLSEYDSLKSRYRKAYNEYTGETYWRKKLNMSQKMPMQREAAE
mgnify:FL=1